MNDDEKERDTRLLYNLTIDFIEARQKQAPNYRTIEAKTQGHLAYLEAFYGPNQTEAMLTDVFNRIHDILGR